MKSIEDIKRFLIKQLKRLPQDRTPMRPFETLNGIDEQIRLTRNWSDDRTIKIVYVSHNFNTKEESISCRVEVALFDITAGINYARAIGEERFNEINRRTKTISKTTAER